MPSLQKQIVWATRTQRSLIVVTALIILTFYVMGYRPLTGRLRALQQLTVAHEALLRSNEERASERNLIAAKNERLRLELDRIKKPSKLGENAEVLKDLTKFKEQASLKKLTYKPGTPVDSELFCEVPIAMTFEGDFMSVDDFLRRIEDMQRLTRVRSLALKNTGHDGAVQAQMALNIYFAAE